jgi:type I restriction enzyme S subunit
MTMPEQKKAVTPRLRFPEFHDAGPWEVKRLGDVCEVNPASPDLPDDFIYIDLESVESGRLLRKNRVKRDNAPIRAQRLLKQGDILYQTVRPYQRNNLLFTIDDGEEYVASTGYAQLRAYESGRFLFQLLHTDAFVYQVLARCTGTNYPAINSSDLEIISVPFPSLCEQQKIADCLSSLDELIELQAKKLEALQTHKKGLMQQLFPREGETTPRLRFPEFRDAGPWEVKRLGEVFCERSERGGNGLELLSVTISDGVVRAAELERKNNANADLSNYKKVCPGDIVYNSMRMWQGASGVSWWHGVVSPAYTVVTPKESQNAVFWAYCFKLEHSIAKFARFSQGVTSDTWNLKYPAFSAIEMAFPAEQAEQQKIADCLSSLDELIELEAKKLEALQAHKKGLMQQLFPQEVG